jgi:hypothetical protein
MKILGIALLIAIGGFILFAQAPQPANILGAVGGGGGGGTVTSVDQTVPSWLTVGGGPITTSGTLAITAATGQTAGKVIGTCGAGTSVSLCGLTLTDLPSTANNTILGNNTGGSSTPVAMTVAQTNVVLGTAPATSSTFGVIKPDNVTITCTAGVCTVPQLSPSVYYFNEDFNGGSTGTAAQIGKNGMYSVTIGGAPTYTGIAGTYPYIGVLQIQTTTTSGQGGAIFMANSTTSNQFSALGTNTGWSSEFIANENTATTSEAMRVGFGTNGANTAIPTNGIYWRHDTSLGSPDTTWHYCIDSSSAETCGDSGISPATGTFFDFYISSTVSGTAIFAIGTAGGAASFTGTICPSSCTTTGTVPTSALTPFLNIVTETSAARTMQIDYLQFLYTGLAR